MKGFSMSKFGLGLLTIGGGVFFLVLVSFALTGCAADPGTPLFVPDFENGNVVTERLEGVWVLRDDNTPSYTVAGDYEQGVCPTGVLHDWVVLVNPPADGDKVFLEGKEPPQFFYRDQLVLAEYPIFEVKKLARSYKEAGAVGEISVADEHDWFPDGEQSVFLIETSLRIKDNYPGRVYLCNDEVPSEWIKDGNWVHFFRREDVVLLNPDFPPEVIPREKLKD